MQVELKDLKKGDTVWYRIGSYPNVYGPCRVTTVSQDHNGVYVILDNKGKDMRLSQEDERDTDFAPTIYSSEPS